MGVSPSAALREMTNEPQTTPNNYFQEVNALKTLLFATCYIGKPEQIERYRRWLNYYTKNLHKLGAERIALIDDGSPMEYLVKLGLPIVKIEEITDGRFPDLTEQAYIFRFPENLGRPQQTIMPGWWRSYSFSGILGLFYDLDKLIHIESDAYILTDKLFEYIKNGKDCWKAMYCFFYRYPESAIQIIPKLSNINWYYPNTPKNNFTEIFHYFYKGKSFWYKDNIGNAAYIPEYCLPFDEIVKDFKGDRYGEDWCEVIPDDIDYIVNINDISLNQMNHKNIAGKHKQIEKLIQAKELTTGTSGFHSGEMGDIVYSIPTIRELGITDLYLNPHQWHTALFDTPRAEFISGLLESEGIKVHILEKEEPCRISYDLDKFRYSHLNVFFDHLAITCGRAHDLEIDITKPWLKPDKGLWDSAEVIINRSAKYHGVFFNWSRVLLTLKNLGCCVAFVGLWSDYEKFIQEFPESKGLVYYHKVADAKELKEVIAGAKLFIGNQSLPFAIAEGLKVKRLQETCEWVNNCMPEDPTGMAVLSHDDMLKGLQFIAEVVG